MPGESIKGTRDGGCCASIYREVALRCSGEPCLLYGAALIHREAASRCNREPELLYGAALMHREAALLYGRGPDLLYGAAILCYPGINLLLSGILTCKRGLDLYPGSSIDV